MRWMIGCLGAIWFATGTAQADDGRLVQKLMNNDFGRYLAWEMGCEPDEVEGNVIDRSTEWTFAPASLGITEEVMLKSYELRCGSRSVIVSAYSPSLVYGHDMRLRKRAPYDLDCPAEKIEVTFIDSVTRHVRGCGMRATYVHHVDLYRRHVWSLNNLVDTTGRDVTASKAPPAEAVPL